MVIIRTYRPVALVLAFLMFFTSIGVSMDFHYCQGELKSKALWVTAKSCHQVETTSHCHQTKKKTCHKNNSKPSCHHSQKEHKDCCDNTSEYHLLDVDFGAAEYAVFTSLQQDFVTAFIYTYVLSFSEREASIIDYQNYKPPLLERHLPILFQSFLW